jgi:hypothetical protein
MLAMSSSISHPFVDNLTQVTPPIALNLTNACRLSNTCYGKLMSDNDKSSHWSSGLAQHLVPEAFPFPEIVELCAKHCDLGSFVVLTSNGKFKPFVITIKTKCTMLETSLGSKVIFGRNARKHISNLLLIKDATSSLYWSSGRVVS